jgi:hypothetical protein
MRPTEYEKRKKVYPGHIKCTSRYVMNALFSHKRPAKVPLAHEPEDSPETRGLTRDED